MAVVLPKVLHLQFQSPVHKMLFLRLQQSHMTEADCRSITVVHDIWDDHVQDLIPPKDPEIQVRALKDYGEMVASNGTIHFQKNAVFFMSQEDAEPLIRHRILERMDMADLH